LAMAMMFFLLSLAGMIPTAGFWAKFFVFRVSLEADVIWIAAVMVVNTVIGLYYYLSLAGRMYLREPSDERGVSVAAPLGAAIAVMAIVIAILTVYPDFFNTFSPRSTLSAADLPTSNRVRVPEKRQVVAGGCLSGPVTLRA
jgi:NADH:ubiquinone oxidoreductase subunit 2 (subunit N)